VAAVISVSSEIEENVERIAAAKGEDTSVPLDGVAERIIGYGDNQNALELAKLKYEKLLSDGNATFDDFLRHIVSRSAVEAATSNRETESRKLFLDHLENLRQSISGVSLDEEMVNMIKFQNAYQAAARMIGVINRAIQLVIGMGM
jgi:flagellar hook-associated protein 1 FlgK